MELLKTARWHDSIGRAVVVNGMFWAVLGLLVVSVSFYGVPRVRGKFIVQAAFWASLFLSYALSLGFRVGLLLYDEPTSGGNLAFNLCLALELSFKQFAFATVVLILQKLSVVCDPSYASSKMTDKLWLGYSALQIPMNATLAVVRYATGRSESFWWTPINIFLAQVVTLVVFTYYRRNIGEMARSASLSVRTHDLLEYTLERFAEFSLVYFFYACVGLCGSVGSFVDIAGKTDSDANCFAYIYHFAEPAAGFYVTLSAMYIFRPRWYNWMRSVKVAGTFNDPLVVGPAPDPAPSVLRIVSNTSASSGSGRDYITVPAPSAGPKSMVNGAVHRNSIQLQRVSEEARSSSGNSVDERSPSPRLVISFNSQSLLSSGSACWSSADRSEAARLSSLHSGTSTTSEGNAT